MADTAELVHVDPATLIVGANVRADTRVDKALVDSVRQRGVLEPIVAYRDADGALVVVHGQRRTLAAVQADVTDVPVWVRDEPLEHDRLVDQVVENAHRAQLGLAEQVAAYEQLSALGVSAAQISKRMAVPRPDVDAALKVAGSNAAKGAVYEHGLSIEQAAALAEFEHRPGVVANLLRTAVAGRGFDHALQAARDHEGELVAADLKAAELTAAGVTVFMPGQLRVGTRWLEELRDADGQPLTAEVHASCPGHAALIATDREWDTDAPEDDPGVVVVSLDYLCTDPDAHALAPPTAGATASAAATPDREEEKRREAEATKRREVIANNKAWRSAETVRREWLRKLAARKTAPKTGAAYVAEALAWGGYDMRDAMVNRNELGHDLLGLTVPSGYGENGTAVAGHLAGATEARALHVALVLVLAASEAATDTNSWRARNAGTERYLRWLQDNGYELSAVEQLAAGLEPQPGEPS